MFRIFSKTIGFIALALTVITAILDLTRSIANSALTITTLGEQWVSIHLDSLLLLQPAIERHVHPFLWNPLIQNILLAPSWLVFGTIAILFLWFGRRKERRWRQGFGS